MQMNLYKPLMKGKAMTRFLFLRVELLVSRIRKLS